MFPKNPNVKKYVLCVNIKFFLISPNRKISIENGNVLTVSTDFDVIKKSSFFKE